MAEGCKSVVYFVNWAIYGRNHNPQDLPAEKLTHVLYSFANVRPESGEVYLTDPWSDTDKHYPTDSWNDTGTNVYGCIKQLFLLKKRNRNLKVLLSIGGWTYSSNFAAPASTESGRKTFAESAVKLVEDLGLDGLDIDWEYPKDQKEGHDLALLLEQTRKTLDAHSNNNSRTFDLTIAVSANPATIFNMPLHQITRHLSFINLMAYDYAGTWSQPTAHQSNLFPSPQHPETTPFSTAAAIEAYEKGGVPRHMIVLGMPLYGRAFANTSGLGSSFSGGGEGSWENGVWDYKALPFPNTMCVHEDVHIGASWGYDESKKLLVSYDTPALVKHKAHYVRECRLGGGMWWESSADKAIGSGESLIETFVDSVGGERRLEKRLNCLVFPGSRFDNLRNGFPGE